MSQLLAIDQLGSGWGSVAFVAYILAIVGGVGATLWRRRGDETLEKIRPVLLPVFCVATVVLAAVFLRTIVGAL